TGSPVPLPEQDRSRWDRAAITQATKILDAALSMARRGPPQIEAAISAPHCRACSGGHTHRNASAALYGLLEELRPTPAVRVNRAFAAARSHGPEVGLALLDERTTIDSTTYPYVHLVRGTLLAELGRIEEARTSLREAQRAAR